MYNYIEAMKEDIREFTVDLEYEGADSEECRNSLYDTLWTEDSVTGNGSGSYTFNAAEAREHIMEDDSAEDYIRELIGEFGLDADAIARHFMDWEYWDVSIRCYLLGQVIADMDDDELHINV